MSIKNVLFLFSNTASQWTYSLNIRTDSTQLVLIPGLYMAAVRHVLLGLIHPHKLTMSITSQHDKSSRCTRQRLHPWLMSEAFHLATLADARKAESYSSYPGRQGSIALPYSSQSQPPSLSTLVISCVQAIWNRPKSLVYTLNPWALRRNIQSQAEVFNKKQTKANFYVSSTWIYLLTS